MQEVKRIGVMSVTKIFSLFGVLAGILAAIYLYLLSKLSSETLIAMDMVPVTIDATVIITTILSSIVMYALAGLIGSFIYNQFSKLVGGIKIDLKGK